LKYKQYLQQSPTYFKSLKLTDKKKFSG